MSTPEEIQWIEKIKAGKSGYFSKLYEKYNKKLYSLCYQFTRNEADAEEQLQEIFLKILEKISTFRKQSSFSTWVTRLSINHLINFQNRQREYNQQLRDETAESHYDPISNFELSLSLTQSIFELPEGYRQVFILHDQLGLRHDEIAEILKIKAATSRSQLCRARLILREKLIPQLQEAVL